MPNKNLVSRAKFEKFLTDKLGKDNWKASVKHDSIYEQLYQSVEYKLIKTKSLNSSGQTIKYKKIDGIFCKDANMLFNIFKAQHIVASGIFQKEDFEKLSD